MDKDNKLNGYKLRGYTKDEKIQIYLDFYNFKEYPTCKNCGKKFKFISTSRGFKHIDEFCSEKCIIEYHEEHDKITKEFIDKYLLSKTEGILNIHYTRYFKNTTREDLYKIYNNVIDVPKCGCGDNCSFLSFNRGYSSACGNLCDYTKKEAAKLGFLHRPKDFGEKVSKGILARTPEQKEKWYKNVKKSKLEKYGDENYNNRPKMKATKLERYNDENYVNIELAKITRKENEANGRVYKETIFNEENFNPEYIKANFMEDDSLDFTELYKYFNCSGSHFDRANVIWNITYKNNRSKPEYEIFKLIPNSVMNTRKVIKPKEIDVYSEEHKFGIEYDGIMYHSYGKNKGERFNNYKKENPNKHLFKTEACEKIGIHLFHIFENEWLDEIKKNVVISMINEKIKLSEIIDTKKCIIKEITKEETVTFHLYNSLESKTGTINLGLFYKDKLYQVMSFSDENITGFSNLLNKSISYDKLIKFYIDNYNQKYLTAKLNRRYYNKPIFSDFKIKEYTEPNYFYFYTKNRKIDLIDEEIDNPYDSGYRKIYDCGSIIIENRPN